MTHFESFFIIYNKHLPTCLTELFIGCYKGPVVNDNLIPIKRIKPDCKDETDDDDLLGLHIGHLVLSVPLVGLQAVVLLFQVERQCQVLVTSER